MEHISQTNRAELNALSARRKKDRETIAELLELLAGWNGAVVARREDNDDKSRSTINLQIDCDGVGAMININNFFGGEWTLIHWYNTAHPARNFTPDFRALVGDYRPTQLHHKSTSHPRDWYTLAALLNVGLELASKDEAFVKS